MIDQGFFRRISRNQREGVYAGKQRGTHRRTKCVQQMLWFSVARHYRFLTDAQLTE